MAVDLDSAVEITDDMMASKCGWTPFAGLDFRSSIAATWVNGNLVWRDGELQSETPALPLQFTR